MLIAMISVVIVISVAMLFAILSSFIPFSNAYWNIVQYNSAYYAAMSAVERWCLAIRYAGPWFDWESWWKYENTNVDWHYQTWNSSDFFLPKFVSYWSAWRTTLYWNVKSKIRSIPEVWQWDVDPAFTNWNLYDYNALNYNSPILIPLWWVGNIDKDHYYTKHWNYEVDSSFWGIEWDFRLTPYLFGKIRSSSSNNSDFAKLCTYNCPWSSDYTIDYYAPIVDWVVKWKVDADGETGIEVSILPSEAVDVWSTYYVHEDRDSVIRKKEIWQTHENKKWSTIRFAANKQPIMNKDQLWIQELNVLSRKSEALRDTNGGSFLSIIKVMKDPYISFELINNLWSEWSWATTWAHHLYPFLEYRFASLGWYFSDRYFTIKWEWKVWKYDVRLQVKKPTIKDSSLWNFTIIF